MMKKMRQGIALTVALAFIGLLQASPMPRCSDQAPVPAATTASSTEQAPVFIEEEGGAAPAGKKSILPILIGVVALGAVAAVLALVVFKTRYDITGTWDFQFTSTSPAHTWVWTLVFRGDKKSGTFDDAGDSGTYTVEGKKVTILYDYDEITQEGWDIQLAGQFDGKDKMSGSATFAGLTIGSLNITQATWSATRASSGSSLRPGAAVNQSAAGRRTRRGGI